MMGIATRIGALVGLVLAAGLVAGCSDSDGGGRKTHPDVALVDRFGNDVDLLSTEPYSPRKTCGPCHDVDWIANGYHFQQGRTDLDGNLIIKDDYFGDGRMYLHSAGMFGKW